MIFWKNEKDTDLRIIDFDGKNKSGLQIAKDVREKYMTSISFAADSEKVR